MIVELRQLNDILKEASKLGIKGKKALVKIYKDELDNSFIDIFKDDALYQSPIAAHWKPSEKDTYFIAFSDVPNLTGILELTPKEVKIVDGDNESSFKLAGYEDLQHNDFITMPYASVTVEHANVSTDIDDLKLAESLVKSGELISIYPKHIMCSPNLRYGGYIIPTENNTDRKFCVSKNGIKALECSTSGSVPISYSTGDNQNGVQIRTNRYVYSERLDTVKRQPDKVPGRYMAISQVLINEFDMWDENHTVKFIPSVDFIDYVTKLDTELARYITFTGKKGSKEVHVKIGDDVDIQTVFHNHNELEMDLAMHLDMKLAEPYFKNLKKYGGSIEYRPRTFMCRFRYSKRNFSGFLLGLKMRGVR